MLSGSTHVVNSRISFFTRLNNILFHLLYPFIYPLMDTCYFYILVIVDNAAMNIGGCRYAFKRMILLPLGIYPGVGLLGYMVVSIFNLLRTCYSVFHCGCTQPTSTSSSLVFPFLCVLAKTCYLLYF